MNQLACLPRRLSTLLLAMASWEATISPALAQEMTGGVKPWVGPYFFMAICIALGIMAVCRSARRKARVRQEYESADLLSSRADDPEAEKKKRVI